MIKATKLLFVYAVFVSALFMFSYIIALSYTANAVRER